MNTQPRADWELAIAEDMGEVLSPEESEQAAQYRQRLAARAEEWPELHQVPDGGTVDLSDVWCRVRDRAAPGEYLDGMELVGRLASLAGGRGECLAQTCRSILRRPDGHVSVYIAPIAPAEGDEHDLIEVIAWSTRRWAADDCAWWVRAHLEVGVAESGRVQLWPVWGVQLAVRDRDGTVIFEDDEHGPLIRILIRWYMDWEGRRAVRDRIGADQPNLPGEPLTMREFLDLVTAR